MSVWGKRLAVCCGQEDCTYREVLVAQSAVEAIQGLAQHTADRASAAKAVSRQRQPQQTIQQPSSELHKALTHPGFSRCHVCAAQHSFSWTLGCATLGCATLGFGGVNLGPVMAELACMRFRSTCLAQGRCQDSVGRGSHFEHPSLRWGECCVCVSVGDSIMLTLFQHQYRELKMAAFTSVCVHMLMMMNKQQHKTRRNRISEPAVTLLHHTMLGPH